MKYLIVEVDADSDSHSKTTIGSFHDREDAVAWIRKARSYREQGSRIVHAMEKAPNSAPDIEPVPAEIVESRQVSQDRDEPQEQDDLHGILRDIGKWTGIR